MDWSAILPLVFFVGLFALSVIYSAIKVVNEWERGVILRLGRLVGAKGPGLFFIIPIVDKMFKVTITGIESIQSITESTKPNNSRFIFINCLYRIASY